MVSAWRNFKSIFSRLLLTIIFRPEMLKFHPYSILTGDTMVEFVIFCVLRELLIIWLADKCRHFMKNCQKTDKTVLRNKDKFKAKSMGSILPRVIFYNSAIIWKRQSVFHIRSNNSTLPTILEQVADGGAAIKIYLL